MATITVIHKEPEPPPIESIVLTLSVEEANNIAFHLSRSLVGTHKSMYAQTRWLLKELNDTLYLQEDDDEEEF